MHLVATWLLIFGAVLPLNEVVQDRQLARYDGDRVTLRGYLFRTNRGEWVLTPQPNTGACCIASPNKTDEQVLLRGKIQPKESAKPVTVRGVLKVNLIHPRYVLEETEIVETEDKLSYLSATVMGTVLCGGLFAATRRKQKD